MDGAVVTARLFTALSAVSAKGILMSGAPRRFARVALTHEVMKCEWACVSARAQHAHGEACKAKTHETDVKKAAPTYRRTPACTEPLWLTAECGWKQGERAADSA